MSESLICLLLLVVVKIVAEQLFKMFPVLAGWIVYVDMGIFAFLVLTAILAIVKVIKGLRK